MPLDENGEGVLVTLGRPYGQQPVRHVAFRQIAFQRWESSAFHHGAPARLGPSGYPMGNL
ncbi:hypothetical protein Scel_11030 [Streptomyces cellostaticus]|nr:hypothetical protein Scel_11030 [Streptomyces cellostaticus]